MKNIKPRTKIIIVITVILFILISFILIRAIIGEVYPHQLKIENFSEYFPDVPEKTKKKLFYQLYLFTNPEKEDTVATIRENSSNIENNHGSAIIDIEELQKSYRISFNLETIENDPEDLVFSCPSKSELIYEGDTDCFILPYDQVDVVTYINHIYLINNVLHEKEAQLTRNTILDFIESPEEYLSAPSDERYYYFEADILENSYKNLSSSSNIIYKISITINDGRSYDVYINSNNMSNVAVFINRTDIEGHSTATVWSDESDLVSLKSWVRSLSNDVEINFKTF